MGGCRGEDAVRLANHHGLAIGQAGERIVIGEVGDPLVGASLLRDVDGDAQNEAGDPSGLRTTMRLTLTCRVPWGVWMVSAAVTWVAAPDNSSSSIASAARATRSPKISRTPWPMNSSRLRPNRNRSRLG